LKLKFFIVKLRFFIVKIGIIREISLYYRKIYIKIGYFDENFVKLIILLKNQKNPEFSSKIPYKSPI